MLFTIVRRTTENVHKLLCAFKMFAIIIPPATPLLHLRCRQVYIVSLVSMSELPDHLLWQQYSSYVGANFSMFAFVSIISIQHRSNYFGQFRAAAVQTLGSVFCLIQYQCFGLLLTHLKNCQGLLSSILQMKPSSIPAMRYQHITKAIIHNDQTVSVLNNKTLWYNSEIVCEDCALLFLGFSSTKDSIVVHPGKFFQSFIYGTAKIGVRIIHTVCPFGSWSMTFSRSSFRLFPNKLAASCITISGYVAVICLALLIYE